MQTAFKTCLQNFRPPAQKPGQKTFVVISTKMATFSASCSPRGMLLTASREKGIKLLWLPPRRSQHIHKCTQNKEVL